MTKKVSDIDKIAQLVQFGKYKSTKIFRRFIRLPHKVKGLFVGNQGMKTSATAFQYIMRIWGTHPIAKFNVLYFECEKRVELFDNVEDHDVYREYKTRYLEKHKSIDSATFNMATRPKDNICPECGAGIVIHKRKTRIFRFASEMLPTEKAGLEGDTIQSAEINNTQYPEFKKWLPPFLIKKDITVRNPAITLFDPNANQDFGGLKYVGADIMVEFVSYNQSVQAGAGVQRLSVWEDEESRWIFTKNSFRGYWLKTAI